MSATSTEEAMTTLATLPAISLDELNSDAALQTRTDRKYIVPMAELNEFLSGFGRTLAVLEKDDLRSFAYESVYFDTPGLDFYRDAAHRRRRRFKVRTRSYLDSDITMLEVKSKGRRKVTIKSRDVHDFDRRRSLDASAASFIDGRLGSDGVAETLRPVLTTQYRRSTLYASEDQARITIDLGLRCTDEKGRCVRLLDAAIIETKTSGPPCAVDRWMRTSGLRAQKVSKFGTALGALRPDLPSNKWHRVINRYFSVTTLDTSGNLSTTACSSPLTAGQ